MSSPTFSIDAGSLAGPLTAAHAQLGRDRFADALWNSRLDVWPPASREHVATRLGWLTVPDVVEPRVAEIEAFAQDVRHDGFTDVVLLGMGGSSLAPEVMRQVLGASPGFPRFQMLDSVNPEAVRHAFSRASSTLFILASKSGSTIEPNVMAAEARRRVEAAGHQPWGSRFVAITDEGTALHTRAEAGHFRRIFLNPANIGGRYSALSLFGMVPAALMGIPIARLLAQARTMADACRDPDSRVNPGLALGAFMATAARAGRDKLTLVVPARLASFGLWVEQLVAESTGKDGTGVVPIVGEPPLLHYAEDRVVVAMEIGEDAPDADVIERLRASGAPVATLRMGNETALGAEFFRWEVATATAGRLLGIDPFDQPDVEAAKTATRKLLSAFTATGTLTGTPPPPADASAAGASFALSAAARAALHDQTPEHVLRLIGRGDYAAILAYVSPGNADVARIVERFRGQVATRTQSATMCGYGPRYLHSTGQLHKGGPPNGVFVILSARPDEDLPIPGEAYSFGVLERAQALGDFNCLDDKKRRALLITLASASSAAVENALARLLAAL